MTRKEENMAVKSEPTDTPLPTLPPKTASELESERKEAVTKFTDLRRACAWPVDRAPTSSAQKCSASKYISGGVKFKKKGKIVLPRNFHSELGNDTKMVWGDEDLNRVVHNWYGEAVPKDRMPTNNPKWINYVTNDGVQPKRHEYLGPAPRVAGYQLGRDGNIHIQFWDGFLQDGWMENEDWQVDVEQDSQGKWVEA